VAPTTVIFHRHSLAGWRKPFRDGGGKVDFHELPPYGGEGHWLVEPENGVKLAARSLDTVLKELRPPAARKP
jgi:hypothetical protein